MLGAQVAAMRQRRPSFRMRWNRNAVSWTGTIQPTAMSPSYEVEIHYRLGERPDVAVISPPLRDRDGEPIPHMYPGKRLCLYLPRAGEWTPADLIAETIVPWISEWLYFYEVWHVTGAWHADGVHPGKKRKAKRKKRALRSSNRVAGTDETES